MTIKFQYKYDAWNRLVQVLLPVVSSTNPYVQYEYDGLNRLIVRQADPGADGTIDETRQFYYTQDWQVVEEQVGATASTARPDVQYVWGTQYVDDLVVRYRDADASGSSGSPSLEEELYSLADANFNVTAVTENDGDVVERFTYTPYGESTALDPDFTSYTGSDYNWKYRYTTRELDPLTGLQLNRNRWYDSLLGRWQSKDPIGYTGGSYNLYEYVNSDPILGLDPSGLACRMIGASIQSTSVKPAAWLSINISLNPSIFNIQTTKVVYCRWTRTVTITCDCDDVISSKVITQHAEKKIILKTFVTAIGGGGSIGTPIGAGGSLWRIYPPQIPKTTAICAAAGPPKGGWTPKACCP